MKSYIQRIFWRLEQDNERISAYLRLGVALLLAASFLSRSWPDPYRFSLIIVLSYIVIALVTIFLSHKYFFRRWLPWFLITIDVVFVFLILRDNQQSLGIHPISVLSLPAAFLIFVILGYASLRSQPLLVMYVGILSVAIWVSLQLVSRSGAEILSPGNRHTLIVYREAVRAFLILLTAGVLAISVGRTKQRVIASIVSDRRASNLSLFLPKEVASSLAYEGANSRLESKRQMAAILFTDIRDFTSMSEILDPVELGHFLGEFRSRVSRAISDHRGVVDKFIGDSIMAVFGSPNPGANDAHDALDAAFAILDTIKDWNRERDAAGLATVGVGIGVHYGEVLAGAIGDDERLEYTVIGDTVNVAQRMEMLTRRVDGDLVVSAETLKAAGLNEKTESWLPLQLQIVEGRKKPISAFQMKRDSS